MSLVFSSSLVRLCSELMELSSLYSQYVPLHLHHLSNSDFSLELLSTDIVSLPERCNGCGLVLMQVSALCQAQCQLQGCRVLFSNVGMMSELSKYHWMQVYPTGFRCGRQVVITLSILSNHSHSDMI